jgi:catalase
VANNQPPPTTTDAGMPVARTRQPRHLARPPRFLADTSEGNYDMVGNNTDLLPPAPDDVPAPRPLADASRPQQPARPRHAVELLDLSPATAHQVTWLMGDRGIPRT